MHGEQISSSPKCRTHGPNNRQYIASARQTFLELCSAITARVRQVFLLRRAFDHLRGSDAAATIAPVQFEFPKEEPERLRD